MTKEIEHQLNSAEQNKAEGGEKPPENLLTPEQKAEELRRMAEDFERVGRGAKKAEQQEQVAQIEVMSTAHAQIEKAFSAEDKEKSFQEKLQQRMDAAINAHWSKLPESDKKKFKSNVGEFNPSLFYETAQKNIFAETADDAGKNGVNVSKEAFCQILQNGSDPENIRVAGPWETIKYVAGGFSRHNTITGAARESISSIAREGTLMAIPFRDEGKRGSEVMTLGKLIDYVAKAETDFKQETLQQIESQNQRSQPKTELVPNAPQPENKPEQKIEPNFKSQEDWYAILGVSPDAPKDVVDSVYRRLAKEYHPDLHKGDKEAERRFKMAADAYGILGDADKRREYDNNLKYKKETPKIPATEVPRLTHEGAPEGVMVTQEKAKEYMETLKTGTALEVRALTGLAKKEIENIKIKLEAAGTTLESVVTESAIHVEELAQKMTGNQEEDLKKVKKFVSDMGLSTDDVPAMQKFGANLYEGWQKGEKRKKNAFPQILMKFVRDVKVALAA